MFKDRGEASVLQAFRISFLDALHVLLQRTQRAVDDTHVVSDMHTLAIVLCIVTRQVHSDALPLVGGLKWALAAGPSRAMASSSEEFLPSSPWLLLLERHDREFRQSSIREGRHES